MEDAIINILIVNPSHSETNELSSYIKKPGHNIIETSSISEAEDFISKIDLGIILIAQNTKKVDWKKFISQTNYKNSYRECFILVTGDENENSNIDQLYQLGISDFIEKPFSKIKVTSKINNFKRLYHKNKTIVNLLENILPHRVLIEFEQHQKYTPKKHTNCSILFADFIGFSQKALQYKPLDLLNILDYYFSSFDSIFEKYQIEKIKTIGDSYMAVGGLHSDSTATEIKMALAALEIKNFIEADIVQRKAAKKDFWEIRIGIHTGDLIAGVIGRKKFAFDVWGDSVNIAARCEQHALPNKINVSEHFKQKIEAYFNFTQRGKVLTKNGREIQMFGLENLKPEFRETIVEGKPNQKIRTLAELPEIDFEGIRTYVMETLREKLDPNLAYHSINHTVKVEKAVIKYCKLEGIEGSNLLLLRTAALFHDTGFLTEYQQNESIAVDHFKSVATKFGYNKQQISFIEQLILATSKNIRPKNIFEEIICDADHDYLGRRDYHLTANHLRRELSVFGQTLSDKEWLEKQINYLDHEHRYFTNSAKNIRQAGKEKRIAELKAKLASLNLKK